MISEEEVKKIIENIAQNGGSQEETWDSLSHINILLGLDQRLNGKVAKIADVQFATSASVLIKKLKEHSLIESQV